MVIGGPGHQIVVRYPSIVMGAEELDNKLPGRLGLTHVQGIRVGGHDQRGPEPMHGELQDRIWWEEQT